MRLVYLVPTLFVSLGGNSQEQQQICNGLAFVGSNRYRSSLLLLAKREIFQSTRGIKGKYQLNSSMWTVAGEAFWIQ